MRILARFVLILVLISPLLHTACGGGSSGTSDDSDLGSKVDTDTPGYKELGCGTDVFEEYAAENNVKGRVINIDMLNNEERLILNESVEEGMIQRVSGTTISEYASQLGVTVGLDASYMWFSTSIKRSFTDSTYRMSQYSYVTLMERHYKNSLKVENAKWNGEYLKNYLELSADLAINNNDPVMDWTPEEVIRTFGTHVMVGIFTGARLDYNLSINITDVTHQSDLQVYAEAKADAAIASATFTTEIEQSTYAAMSNYDQRENILTKGGDEQYARPSDDEDYQLWKASIDDNPALVGIIKNSLIPIWELADDPARRDLLHNYFIEYAEGKASDFDPLMPFIITDIKVSTDIPTTEPGFIPLKDITGSSTNAYVNRGVSSERTPARKNDSIMEATKVWIAVKSAPGNYTLEDPVSGIHMLLSDETQALLDDIDLYGSHGISDVDFNTDVCETASYYHTTPCPTSLCAYDCDNAYCYAPSSNFRYLHHTSFAQDEPIQAVVLGNSTSLNTSNSFETRKANIWWGPQDINNDGNVDDADAQHILNNIVWLSDELGGPINLNEGADNYYVYDYECPWGCCWVKTSISDSPAQYLGYVRY